MNVNTIGIVANLTKKMAVTVAKDVINILKSSKINVVLEKSLATALKKPKLGLSLNKLAEEVDVVISLGGDGTFLRVARITQRHLKPILGVNLGELGFLAEVKLENIGKDLKLLINGNYVVNYRETLKTEVIKKNDDIVKVKPALNDIVISKEEIARIIKLQVYVNDEYVTSYRADGVIVATPTGSTAYNMSAGGPIVNPNADVITLTPICPHTLTHRPLVLTASDKIRIQLDLSEKDVALTVDGQVNMKLSGGESVVVTKGERKVPLIIFKDTSYFKVLREKLKWGK